MTKACDVASPEGMDTAVKTVDVFVDGNYYRGLRKCKAIFVKNNTQIADVVRQIYGNVSTNYPSRKGSPNILLTMVANGNSLSFETSERLTKGICRLIKRCCLWTVTSGERSNSLATILASAVQSTLPQSESLEEAFIIAINLSKIARKQRENGLLQDERIPSMIDAHENTLFVLHEKPSHNEKELFQFRSLFSVALANPPAGKFHVISFAQNWPFNIGMAEFALPISFEMPTFIDRNPLPAVLFCGSVLSSLSELRDYVEYGVPTLIIEDASTLCATLKGCFTLYESVAFEHDRFMDWLDHELRSLARHDGDIDEAKKNICRILSLSIGEQPLIAFISKSDLENLPEKLLDLFAKSARDPGVLRRVLHLAVKLDISNIIRTIDIKSIFERQQISHIMERALTGDGKINALSALLDQNVAPHVSPSMLMRWHRRTTDKYFFNAIVLGHCLGREPIYEMIDENLVCQLNELLHRLSGGIGELLPPDFLTELALCLCAYVSHPIAFSLVLAKTARGLAHECRDWFFYEERLRQLGKNLNASAVALLNTAYTETPDEAYEALCIHLDAYNGLTLTQMAYEVNAKEFISHECCQRWVLRLLYGNLQLRSFIPFLHFPSWLKIIIGGIFIFPSFFWVTARSKNDNIRITKRHKTAILRNGKFVNSDTDNYHITKQSEASLDLLAKSHDVEYSALKPDAGKLLVETDSISEYGSEVDETEVRRDSKSFAAALLRHGMQPIQQSLRNVEKLRLFYTTPITKYWLSLICRLLYLTLFAFSLALPSCGSMSTDAALWIWSFSWLLESLYVVERSNWQQMPWTIFDISCVTTFLFVHLVNHFTTTSLHHAIMSAYTRKSIWSAFLLYQCYTTLFIYVPLSDLFGPLLVRLKLMIMRDFVNFVVLISLFVFSSAIATKAVLYPDLHSSVHVLSDSVSWAWLSLFNADMSMLTQSNRCRELRVADREIDGYDHCEAIGGYEDATCPTQSFMSYFTVIEFFVILKLISIPILFALFARTVKIVEDEATHIWKFQMYSLATEFSIRPFLPPPLTFIFFLGLFIVRSFGLISGVFYRVTSAPTEHPDVRASLTTATHSKNVMAPSNSRQYYWTRLSVNHWKSQFDGGFRDSVHKCCQSDQMNALLIHKFTSTSNRLNGVSTR
ncbi:protein ced-11 [Ditylenchus destructor]|uniref:Protein ced-11 n=1 Tax=Ditylenchus destructor TaxID=166010 RepID=A0AAD4MV83_9BILA|nr:protein ced-11 [Ditylenchus destructor]